LTSYFFDNALLDKNEFSPQQAVGYPLGEEIHFRYKQREINLQRLIHAVVIITNIIHFYESLQYYHSILYREYFFQKGGHFIL